MELGSIIREAAEADGLDMSDEGLSSDDGFDGGEATDDSAAITEPDTSGEATDDTDSGAENTDAASDAAATEPATSDEPPAAPELSEEEELAQIASELTKNNPSLNKGKLPVARHQAILERQRRLWESQRAADIEKATAKYTSVPDIDAKIAAVSLMETDPQVFFSRLARQPQYAGLLKQIVDHAVQQRQSQPPPAAAGTPPPPAAANATMPDPDVMLPDGSMGYSAPLQRQILEAREAQLRTEFSDQLRAQVAQLQQTLNPFVEERRQQEFRQQLGQVADRAIQSASRWEGFSKYQKEITDEVNKKQYDGLNAEEALQRAYDAVVPARLKADRANELAQQKNDLLKKAAATRRAAAAAPGSSVPSAPAGGGSRTIKEIVRETAQRLMAEEA